MILKLIFIIKHSKKVIKTESRNTKIALSSLQGPVIPMLKKCLNHTTGNIYSFQDNEETYEVTCTCTKNVRDAYYFTIDANYSPQKNAYVLHKAYSIITKGEHRKNFSIIASFDEASEYYCDKIFFKFDSFERKMRNLIFNVLVESLGERWAEFSLSADIRKELLEKGINQNKLIEEALHELTIMQLEKFLFVPFREVEPAELIDKELTDEHILEMEKSDLIEHISKSRARSIWDRYFANEINIQDLETKLASIRRYRNSIAHHKYFDLNDYKTCKSILIPLIKDLDKAIQITEIKKIELINMSSVLSAFSTLMSEYSMINENMSKVVSDWAQVLKSIELPKFEFSKFDFVYPNFEPIISRTKNLLDE